MLTTDCRSGLDNAQDILKVLIHAQAHMDELAGTPCSYSMVTVTLMWPPCREDSLRIALSHTAESAVHAAPLGCSGSKAAPLQS